MGEEFDVESRCHCDRRVLAERTAIAAYLRRCDLQQVMRDDTGEVICTINMTGRIVAGAIERGDHLK